MKLHFNQFRNAKGNSTSRRLPRLVLSVESLEGRELLAAAPLASLPLVEGYDAKALMAPAMTRGLAAEQPGVMGNTTGAPVVQAGVPASSQILPGLAASAAGAQQQGEVFTQTTTPLPANPQDPNYDVVTVANASGFPLNGNSLGTFRPFAIAIHGEPMWVTAFLHWQQKNVWILSRGGYWRDFGIPDVVRPKSHAAGAPVQLLFRPSPEPTSPPIPDDTRNATTLTWTGAGDGVHWSDKANWTSGQAPRSGDTLVFGGDAKTKNSTNNIDGLTLKSILFTGSGYHLAGKPITLTGELGQQIGDNTYSLNTHLSSTLSLNVNGGTLHLKAGLDGDGELTIRGKGVLDVTTSWALSGETVVRDGATLLVHKGDLTLGKGSLNLHAGTTIRSADNGLTSFDTPVDLYGSVTIDMGSGMLVLRRQATVREDSKITLTRGELALSQGMVLPGTATQTLTLNGTGRVTITGKVACVLVAAGDIRLSLAGITLQGPSAEVQVTEKAFVSLSDAVGIPRANGATAIAVKGGTLRATTNPKFSGKLTLSGGTIELDGTQNPLGSGTLELQGGTIRLKNTSSLANAIRARGHIILDGDPGAGLSILDNVVLDAECRLTIFGGLTNGYRLQFAPLKTISGRALLTLSGSGAVFMPNNLAADSQLVLESVSTQAPLKVNLVGRLQGPTTVVNVKSGAEAILDFRQGPNQPWVSPLTGLGTINVMGGKLQSNTSHPQFRGNITMQTGTITIADGAGFSPLGWGGRLSISGGKLVSLGDNSLGNPITVNGDFTLASAQRLTFWDITADRSRITLEKGSTIRFLGRFHGLANSPVTFDGVGTVETNEPTRVKNGPNVKVILIDGYGHGDLLFKRWEETGGSTGTLGMPNGAGGVIAGGTHAYLGFEHGNIYERLNDRQVFAVEGSTFSKYAATGYEHGFLGLPVSNAVAGVHNSRYSSFERGAIVHYTDTGRTFEIHGDIYKKYLSIPDAVNVLGRLKSDEIGLAGGVRASVFERGAISWTAKGTFEVHGAIFLKYQELGGAGGLLGVPTTDERATAAPGGRFNFFSKAGNGVEDGVIAWSAKTGAHEVHGAIFQKYRELGGTGGPLGLPTTDERATAAPGGRFNFFSKAGNGVEDGVIAWSARTGAHAVYGAIFQKYKELGGTGGRLGLPTTDVTVTGNGQGRYCSFQGGVLYQVVASGKVFQIDQSNFEAVLQQARALGWDFVGQPREDSRTTVDGVGRVVEFDGNRGRVAFLAKGTGPSYALHGAIMEKYVELGATKAGPIGDHARERVAQFARAAMRF